MIYKMSSLKPLTDYAPSWDFPIGVSRWKDSNHQIKNIKKWLLDNEQRFIKQYPVNFDGGTGLGNQSVTSRFGRYNLFNFVNELPELQGLLHFFRISYLEFIKEDKSEIKDLDIVCWFNVIRDQQKIDKHHHGAGHDVYLSGNFVCDNYPTKTIYQCPFDANVEIPVVNQRGTLSIFPTCLPHYSTLFESNIDQRVTIAFDLRLTTLKNVQDLTALPFINQTIIEELEYDLYTS